MPIDLDEIEHDPGFRGMLSFLEVSPEDRAALLAKRDEAEALAPSGQLPVGDASDGPPPVAGNDEPPMGESPGDLFPGTGREPVGELPSGAVPYLDVEGRGKRALRFCRTVQDAHTASEQLAFQSLWNHAQRFGRPESSGSFLVDIGLTQLCKILSTDHKNVKRLVGSLRDKLVVEIVRQPDYRLAVPTRYRIFSATEILERRRNAGLVWVIRTRTVRFVDLETVNRLLADAPGGQLPAGEQPVIHTPVGGEPGRFPVLLAESLRRWIPIDDDAVRQIWHACRRGLADCTEEEVAWFCRSKEPLIRSGTIDNPVALLVRSVPQLFARGGAAALHDYRKEQARAQERERKRQRQVAMMVLDDAESTEAETAWAKQILAS